MKSFLEHLKEEVLPTVQVADGGLDISKPAVRAAINAAIAGVVSQPAVTPYVVFNRLSKLLAQYHIVLPKRFLEGDKGVEVFEVKQFGHKMGMTDSGEFVNEVPATHYLFLQYGILSPFGITYAKPVVGGMFKVMARLVDKEELDKLMDMAEITMAEEAEQMQAIAKANAPKEGMHTALGDCDCSQGDSPSTKKAVKVSMKKIDEEQIDEVSVGKLIRYKREREGDVRATNISASHSEDMAKHPGVSSGKRKEFGDEAKWLRGKQEKMKAGIKLADAKLKGKSKVGASMPKNPYMEEEKDPCWKGYEMIGMKKKGGRSVPNCVPVKEEEQIDELTGKGKLPALKAVYKGDKDYHTRSADYHAARADRAERRGEDSKAERHMDAGYGHEHKAERAEAKSKRASALMVRAKANADIKASKAASKSARAEYNEETQIDEISTKLARSYLSKATDVGSNKRRTQGVFRARGKMTGEPYEKVDKSGITVGHVSPKVLTKEEQIDELSKDTLRSYVAKRGSQLSSMKYGPDRGDKSLTGRQQKNAVIGIKRAMKEEQIDEKAPPGAKFERMVKHIKKGYAEKDGLSKKEKSIAYATAWKAKNREKGE